MKLTKYGHACIVLEEQGQKLVIDPGIMTPELGDVSGVVAIVITHGHADHVTKEHLDAILSASPGAKISTPSDAAEKLTGMPVTAVKAGDKQSVGPFKLEFSGDLHHLVHESWPVCENVGVMVNETLYYPGDSYTTPGRPVKVLALPVSGPWLKTGEVMDYLDAVKPGTAFPTHDGMLSVSGKAMYEDWTKQLCAKHNITWRALEDGESMDI
ncbi:MAG TPA: MBL fold metallo-hydrolase [Patescibacteria group bacterium]|nr:MBL fold metallo-hydrolase [Patescibacteria group bacterium]